MLEFVRRFVSDERGLETVEWAVMAALILTGIIAAVTTLGTTVSAKFTALNSAFK